PDREVKNERHPYKGPELRQRRPHVEIDHQMVRRQHVEHGAGQRGSLARNAPEPEIAAESRAPNGKHGRRGKLKKARRVSREQAGEGREQRGDIVRQRSIYEKAGPSESVKQAGKPPWIELTGPELGREQNGPEQMLPSVVTLDRKAVQKNRYGKPQ